MKWNINGFSGNNMSEKSFTCRRCGHCCHGRGGIVVGQRDLPRLLAYFKMEKEEFLQKYTEEFDGKPTLITGDDEYCFFFKEGAGCTIHEARPDVCRAWPYFRGNLIDEFSFAMAKEDCPGIDKSVSHAFFAHDGYAYLKENNLLCTDKKTDGRALIVAEEELPRL